MSNYKIEKYNNGDYEIEIIVDQTKRTIWLNEMQLSILFKVSRKTINYHIKNIFDKGELGFSVCQKICQTATDNKNYLVKCYNLQMIEILNYHLRSQKGIELKKWVEKYFEDTENKNKEIVQIEDKDSYLYEYEVVKYKNDGVELDVKVSPNEDTVWLTQKQICTLFGTNKSTLSFHIANILSLEELDNSVVRKNRTTASDGKKYFQNLYNLEMVISIGYRVNSKKGIVFRRWANSILKQYFLKGYAVDERAVITKDNYLNLVNKVIELDKDVSYLKKALNNDTSSIFYKGQYFDAYAFICEILNLAEKEIVLIDPYLDMSILKLLAKTDGKIKWKLISSSKGKIKEEDVIKYNEQYLFNK